MDFSAPGSSVPGILWARILERAAGSFSNACMHAKSLQSCPTLCDPTDGSPLGSPVHGILQARILEWVAISFSLHMWNLILKIKLQMNLFTKQKQNYRYGEQICGYQKRNVGRGGGNKSGTWDEHTLLCMITNKDLLYCTGNSTQYSVITGWCDSV